MANDTPISIIGNLTDPPELRFTQNGVAVASFTIASTPRSFDKQSNEWKDGEALFMRCSIWRDAAENVAESLEKGSRVIAQGRLKQRSFTDREGNNRTSIELDVDEVGPSLKYATAKPNKVQRNKQGGGFGGGAPRGGGYGQQPQQSQGYGQQAPQQGYSAPQGGQQGGDPWAGAPMDPASFDAPPFR